MTIGPNCSRTGEALLAGAGCPVPHHCDCDLTLDRIAVDRWEISIRSPRADAWVRKELCEPLGHCLGGSIVVDVLSADRFIKNARAQGFRIEFVGLGGKDLL
ncbi:hypothetical protein SAMN02927900_05991 [Rhizobium mongolense subsp. loessense]|uniref:Uncharacterized protein n=1 Tax=Rhizobium mongolense subsp. loessense TaxID=158890 RepID=A0A1G4U223_9HYPH|nr:hypothetical protein [Rhizobium mongolense]SCW87664.1 hypothetical protein SAMN02927900_05991 [Rhizobium mongolense subsp. loessense]